MHPFYMVRCKHNNIIININQLHSHRPVQQGVVRSVHSWTRDEKANLENICQSVPHCSKYWYDINAVPLRRLDELFVCCAQGTQGHPRVRQLLHIPSLGGSTLLKRIARNRCCSFYVHWMLWQGRWPMVGGSREGLDNGSSALCSKKSFQPRHLHDGQLC